MNVKEIFIHETDILEISLITFLEEKYYLMETYNKVIHTTSYLTITEFINTHRRLLPELCNKIMTTLTLLGYVIPNDEEYYIFPYRFSLTNQSHKYGKAPRDPQT